MILKQFSKDEYPGSIRILIKCDTCDNEFVSFRARAKRYRKKYEADLCLSCKTKYRGFSENSICSKKYWEDETHRKKRVDGFKNSLSLHKSLSESKKGAKNPMFGKTHSDVTKNAMSISRTGKKQTIETVQKRIKTIRANTLLRAPSLLPIVKRTINAKYTWSKKVLERDKFICTECGSNVQLDAHHIVPFSILIKKLLSNKKFETREDIYNFLIIQECLIDINLENGITLCRKCHKEVHKHVIISKQKYENNR